MRRAGIPVPDFLIRWPFARAWKENAQAETALRRKDRLLYKKLPEERVEESGGTKDSLFYVRPGVRRKEKRDNLRN